MISCRYFFMIFVTMREILVFHVLRFQIYELRVQRLVV